MMRQTGVPAAMRWISLGMLCNAALALPGLWLLWPGPFSADTVCAAALALSGLCLLPVVTRQRRFSPRRMLEEVGWVGLAYIFGCVGAFCAAIALAAATSLLPSLRPGQPPVMADRLTVINYAASSAALALPFLGGWSVVRIAGAAMRSIYGHQVQRWSAVGGGTSATLLVILMGRSTEFTSLLYPLTAVMLSGLPWLLLTAPYRAPKGPLQTHNP